MISKEDIEKIRKAVDIIDYLSFRGVEAHQAGTSWKALCPIHSERSPSFHIKPETKTWHCFGCGNGGDIFSLVQEMDELNFSAAIQELAEYAGIKLVEQEDEEFKKVKRLYQLTELTSAYFRQEFERLPDEHPAKIEFSKRNLLELANEDETIGFAPNNGMIQFLQGKGFSKEDMKEVGLLSEKENALFRKRVIWSIRNIQGKVVGFTARKIYEADLGGKYINSPQTRIYNKSQTLFGLFEAHKAITKQQSVYIVEGQMDVMALRAIGITNVVAPNGTAFTKEQSLLLQRLADRGKESKQFTVNFCFDGDSAGIKAAKKVFEVEPSLQTTANVVEIEEGQGDPCDIRLNEGDAYLEDVLLNKRVSLLEFILKKELEEWDVRTPEGQAKFIAQASLLLEGIDNNVVLESYKRKISWWTGVPLSNISISGGKTINYRPEAHAGVSSGELRKRVVAALLQFPEETYEAIQASHITVDMFKNASKDIFETSLALIEEQMRSVEYEEDENFRVELRPDQFENPKMISELIFLNLTAEEELNSARKKSIVANICKVFINEYKSNENNMIQARILAASEDNNLIEDEDLLKEILDARASLPITRRRAGKKYTFKKE